MHEQEPFPRHILGLLSLGWRIVIGASLGFLSIAIIGANSNGTAFTRGEGLYQTIVAAWRTGASLGFWLVTFAIYQHDHRSRTSHGRGSFLP